MYGQNEISDTYREREIINSTEYNEEDNKEKINKRLRILTKEETSELEDIEEMEAEGRQIFDPTGCLKKKGDLQFCTFHSILR